MGEVKGKIVPAPPDGSCGYHALKQQCKDIGKDVCSNLSIKEMRKEAVKALKKCRHDDPNDERWDHSRAERGQNAKPFENNEEWYEAIENGEWIDATTLQALSMYFKVNIAIVR